MNLKTSPPSNGLLAWRRLIGVVFAPFVVMVLFLLFRLYGYRIENRNATREFYRRQLKSGRPILICANHLSYLDPLLLMWAFASPWDYLLLPKSFPWNVAASEVVAKHPVFAAITYLSKVLYIERNRGASYVADYMQRLGQLLSHRETLLIFPEGRRSRSGYFEAENVKSGYCHALTGLSSVSVICAHIRSQEQDEISVFPKRGSKFSVLIHEFVLEGQALATAPGVAVSQAIGRKIADLEKEYLANKQLGGEKKWPRKTPCSPAESC